METNRKHNNIKLHIMNDLEDEVILDSNGDQVTGDNLNKKNWYYNKNK